MHFRGPTWLKQLAVYYPDSGSHSKRSSPAKAHSHRHNHRHLHHAKRKNALAERAVGDEVIATIDGQVVSWINQYAGPGASPSNVAAQPASVQTTLATSIGSPAQTSTAPVHASSAVVGSKQLSDGDGSTGGSDSWLRQAYYNAEAGTSDGFTFLNHFGGTQGMPGTTDGGPA